jgi:hypothetical protein
MNDIELVTLNEILKQNKYIVETLNEVKEKQAIILDLLRKD